MIPLKFIIYYKEYKQNRDREREIESESNNAAAQSNCEWNAIERHWQEWFFLLFQSSACAIFILFRNDDFHCLMYTIDFMCAHIHHKCRINTYMIFRNASLCVCVCVCSTLINMHTTDILYYIILMCVWIFIFIFSPLNDVILCATQPPSYTQRSHYNKLMMRKQMSRWATKPVHFIWSIILQGGAPLFIAKITFEPYLVSSFNGSAMSLWMNAKRLQPQRWNIFVSRSQY